MRVALFGKGFSDFQGKVLQLLLDALQEHQIEVVFFEPYLRSLINAVSFHQSPKTFNTYEEVVQQADMLLSVGGDGTILDTVPYVRGSGIPILGINLGRMGFLSGVSKDEIETAIGHVKTGNYTLDSRTLLQLHSPRELFGDLNFALNDLTIYRNANPSLILVHVFVDNLFLNTYYGDGLIVATPTGSTAYSLSVGGPILTPGSQNFVIAPIASHNLTVRPIVIQDSSTIKIKVEGREAQYLMSLDSRQKQINTEVELVIKKCDFEIKLISMPEKTFFSTIRDKLLWGVDYRQQQSNLNRS